MTHLSMGDALLTVPGKDEAKNTAATSPMGATILITCQLRGPTKVSHSDPSATQLNRSPKIKATTS